MERESLKFREQVGPLTFCIIARGQDVLINIASYVVSYHWCRIYFCLASPE